MSRPSYTARLAYKEVAGHQIHLEVWLPADATGPVPAVAFLHGGGELAPRLLNVLALADLLLHSQDSSTAPPEMLRTSTYLLP